MEQIDFVTVEEQQRPRKRGGSQAVTEKTSAKKSPRQGAAREGYRRLTADIPADLHKRLKMQALMEVSGKLMEAAQQSQAGAADAGDASAKKDDDVVDAEFEEVKDNKK